MKDNKHNYSFFSFILRIIMLIYIGLLSINSRKVYAQHYIIYPTDLISWEPSSFRNSAEVLLYGPNTTEAFAFFNEGREATYGAFYEKFPYDQNDLLDMLIGVDANTLKSVDCISFDGNGTTGGGFESSVWIFTDGVHTLTHIHKFGDTSDGLVIANIEARHISQNFKDFFNIDWGKEDYGILLFNLPGLNTASPDFRVTLKGEIVGPDCGIDCPDVAVLGLINVPDINDINEIGPRIVMQEPMTPYDGVFTDQTGITLLRILWSERIAFSSQDIQIIDSDNMDVPFFTSGSNSDIMTIFFDIRPLLNDRFTITILDSVKSAVAHTPIDGDNDGFSGGDAVIVMEHRERHDSDNDNDIDFYDLANFANKWLWME